MEHKLIIAHNLREGLIRIKQFYMEAWNKNHLIEQWQYISIKIARDIDWHDHKEIIENNFAWKSQKLLRQIQGD